MTYTKIPIGFDQANSGDKNPLIKVPNKFLGGFKIYSNLTDMYHEPLDFLSLNNTFTVVKDKGNGKPGMYIYDVLSLATTAPYTNASNWKFADLNDFVNGLSPQGTWDASTFNAATHKIDADAEIGHFYVVIGADVPVIINDAAMFNGVSTSVSTGDWILGNGISFELVATLTPSLDQIRAADTSFNSRIAQIMDDGMPTHTHDDSEISVTKTIGATPYTSLQSLLEVIVYEDTLAVTGNVSSEQAKLWTYGQLSAIFKDEAAINTLITNYLSSITTGSTEEVASATASDIVSVAFLSFNFYNKDEIATQIANGSDVSKVGTPVNNQVGVWAGDGPIKGDVKLTWSGSQLVVGGHIGYNVEIPIPKSANYTLLESDNGKIIEVDGAYSIIFPPIILSNGFSVQIVNITASTVTLDRTTNSKIVKSKVSLLGTTNSLLEEKFGGCVIYCNGVHYTAIGNLT